MSEYETQLITTHDGLKLFVRRYGAAGKHLPVVCLPGLARNSADFHRLALALSSDADHPRQVFAMDARGRGQSDYDPNPANYNVGIEVGDLLTMMAALGIARAVFIGTSRGGILTMVLASIRPDVIAGAVLNDIGPVIEPAGLLRIKGYVGKLSQPASFEEGGEMMRRLFGSQFTRLTPDDWTAYAQRTFELRDGKIVPAYDLQLAQTLATFDITQELPALWPQFDALSGVPVMVVRGENSDLLSPQTVEEMRRHRPDLEVLEVPAQGHAPLLVEDDMIARIGAFVARCERS